MSPEPIAQSPAPRVTVNPVTYTARQTVDVAGEAESQAAYRMALDAAREAGIPDEARVTAFATSRSASFSFVWLVPAERVLP